MNGATFPSTTSVIFPAGFRLRRVLISTIAALGAGQAATAGPVHQYVFFNLDRERIHESWFADHPTFEGAQLKYSWKELEPTRDHYELGVVLADLAYLKAKGKRLFIQLQDTTFTTNRVMVPDYLRDDPEFHGGADLQYEFTDDAETRAVPEGWVARRWDPAVQARFDLLLRELGRQLDGRIEGINLPETAVGFGVKTNRHPAGFTFDRYRDAIEEIMSAARAALPHSVVMQYANFMPGEWLPWSDHDYLKSIYRFAVAHRVGVGGPDLLPFRKGQLNHSYPLIEAAAGKVPTGIAVQWGNYEARDPISSKRITVDELFKFARDTLKVDYIFWSLQEPYFTRDVLPYLKMRARRAAEKERR